MPMRTELRKRLRLPRRIALMFGIGAISAVGANADGPPPDAAGPARPQTRSCRSP